jgi:uncharacterized protein involved in exopolysaccharide biosynthesis
VLQTLGSNESYGSGEPAFEEYGRDAGLGYYTGILKRRFFYFVFPFGLISILGLYAAAIQKPNYLSEGKILVESQVIAPDLVRPIVTVTASERIQSIEQRIMTRDNLLSIASKFGLFPGQSGVLDLMVQSTQIKPVEVVGQSRPGSSAIAFTVGFEYEKPELAMRVANEFITLIVNEDTRSQTSRATEAVKILSGEARDIQDKLDATQAKMAEIARRPRETVPEIPEQEKAQLTALTALRAELIQKTSIYSEAHPVVVALKKRIAAMEKTITQSSQGPAKAQSTQPDEIDALKRQREALEKQLADANGKLAAARLGEKLDRDQQSERLQVIEAPPLPQRPLKSNRLKIAGVGFAAAAMLGLGIVVAAELLNGSIRGRHQLQGVVASSLIVSIPYIETHADVVRKRLRGMFGFVTVVLILMILIGLVLTILLNLPMDSSWFKKAAISFGAASH